MLAWMWRGKVLGAVLFSVSDRKLCGISKYISKLDIFEGERQTGKNKIVCFAKGIFK